MSMEQDIFERLKRRIEDLERQTYMLQAQTNPHPLQPLFLARVEEDGTWQEQTIINGAVEDWPQARRCANDAHPSAITDREEAVVLLEVRDGDDYRYVEVGGGGEGGSLTIQNHDGIEVVYSAERDILRFTKDFVVESGGATRADVSIRKGDAQYHVLQMVTATEVGWGPVRLSE